MFRNNLKSIMDPDTAMTSTTSMCVTEPEAPHQGAGGGPAVEEIALALAQLNELTSVTSYATRERRPILIFIRGELPAAPVTLERDEVILGRAPEADIRIDDVCASRLHARITIERDPQTGEMRCRVTDLGSTNGTFINGRPVTEAFLQDGDNLIIGTHMLCLDLND